MLLDVSMPVDPRIAAFPGDVPFSCGWTSTTREGGEANVGWVRTSPHVGTHVDAPFHVDEKGHRIGGFDLEAFVGPCVVVDAVGESELGVELLRAVDLALAPRVLFRTQRRSDPTSFRRDFPVLTREACEALARARVRLVGIDAPSVDPVDSREMPVHHALAAAGIANVENMVLDRADPGMYEIFAAPVAWREMDAAPVRAILRR